jgi:hypothetical protein
MALYFWCDYSLIGEVKFPPRQISPPPSTYQPTPNGLYTDLSTHTSYHYTLWSNLILIYYILWLT